MGKDVRVANTESELSNFLREVLDSSQFELEKIRLVEQRQWSLAGGNLAHVSGGFFSVTGVRGRDGTSERLALYQPQNGITGLAICSISENVYVLLQLKIEPGNSGVAQYGPTIQCTPANYRKSHGGKSTPCVELFTEYRRGANLIANTVQLDLGERYFQKTKTHSYVQVPELLPTDENMI